MTSTKHLDPFASSRAPSPETTETTVLKLECKQLLEKIKETCERLPEKEQHLFAADCTQRNRLTFHVYCYQNEQLKTLYCAEDERLREVVEVRRRWANGQASEEEWRAAQGLALQIAQKILPQPEDAPATQDLKTGASYAAKAVAADPFDAVWYTTSALFLIRAKLSQSGAELLWQWKRAHNYLRGKVTEESDRREMKRSLEQVLARIDDNMARDEQMTKEEQEELN